ncbi:MAG: hypothetical protein ABJB12_12330 [Pseudomonadota bacterium]
MATSHRLRELLPSGRELALLIAARGLACLVAWAYGFRALSDDDYARISIAQGFAAVPRWDPTDTSWLPAPFWAYGSAFRAFGTDLGVARAAAVAASLAATALIYVAARVLGARRLSALLSAALSSLLLPYSVLLGIAAVPEVPCAALMLFGASTLARPDCRLRALGGLALSAACLSRYEAWPLALVFLGYCLCDAAKRHEVALALGGVLGASGLAWWLMMGNAQHGDALFFIARVTAYKRALGGTEPALLTRVLDYPKLLLSAAWPLWLLYALSSFASRKHRTALEKLSTRRLTCALFSVLVFLIIGSVRGGVPTHHAARVLLPLWFYGCVMLGPAAAALVAGKSRLQLGLAVLTLLLALSPLALPLESLAQRGAELEAGAAARRFTSGSLAIDTPDYGYTAVQAAFGTPVSARALDEHDPRHPDPDPFASPEALRSALQARNAHFALVTARHAPLLTKGRGFTELWRNDAFVLFAWQPNPES